MKEQFVRWFKASAIRAIRTMIQSAAAAALEALRERTAGAT